MRLCHALRLELIGDAEPRGEQFIEAVIRRMAPRRPPECGAWEVLSFSPYQERSLRRQRDHARASGTGNRGIFGIYILGQWRMYRVAAPCSWSSVDRFYCRVLPDGTLERMDLGSAREWMQAQQGSCFEMRLALLEVT